MADDSKASDPQQERQEEPVWLSRRLVQALHDESIDLFGGAPGLRDEGLLESALARPKHLWTYGDDPALPELAAAYGSGLIQNHPFADGNKRVGLLAIRAFLFQNGHRFEPGEAEAVAVIRSLAASSASEPRLAAWIEENTTAIGSP